MFVSVLVWIPKAYFSPVFSAIYRFFHPFRILFLPLPMRPCAPLPQEMPCPGVSLVLVLFEGVVVGFPVNFLCMSGQTFSTPFGRSFRLLSRGITPYLLSRTSSSLCPARDFFSAVLNAEWSLEEWVHRVKLSNIKVSIKQ